MKKGLFSLPPQHRPFVAAGVLIMKGWRGK